MDSEANDRLGKILDYIGSSDAPYAGTGARKGDIGLGDGYTPISPFIPGLADVVGAYRSGSDLDMFYDMMGLQPVDGNPNLVNIPTNTLNIDGKTIQKTLNDAFAAAGLDQQGNPIEEIVDLSADTTASNIPAFDTTLDNTISKETTESTSELTPEQIMEKYKTKTVDDLVRDYPGAIPEKIQGENINPFKWVVDILINEVNKNNNKNAEQILINSGVPIAGPDGAFDGDGAVVGTGDAAGDAAANNQAAYEGAAANNQAGANEAANRIGDGNTDTDLKADNATDGATSGAVVDNTGEAGTVDTSTGSTPTVSTGSVLDQSGTENVNVDDQPIGLPNIPISTPRQPEKKAGMIMQISQSAPIVETVFDDILFEPKFTKLNNIPEFGVVGGLLRTLA